MMAGSDPGPDVVNLKGQWDGFKAMWVGCDTEKCEVWGCIRVKVEFDEKAEPYMCGVCAAKVVSKLKEENKGLQNVVNEQKKNEDKRKEKDEAEKELLGDWIHVSKRIKEDKVFEKLEKVVTKDTVKEAVKESTDKEMRDRRMIVFNLDKSDKKTDRDLVREIFGVLHVDHRIREEDVVDVQRMRDLDNMQGDKARPVVVEFKTSYEKWIVMNRKAYLRNEDQFKKVFLEMDRNKEEREVERARRRLVWEERDKVRQRVREEAKAKMDAQTGQEEKQARGEGTG